MRATPVEDAILAAIDAAEGLLDTASAASSGRVWSLEESPYAVGVVKQYALTRHGYRQGDACPWPSPAVAVQPPPPERTERLPFRPVLRRRALPFAIAPDGFWWWPGQEAEYRDEAEYHRMGGVPVDHEWRAEVEQLLLKVQVDEAEAALEARMRIDAGETAEEAYAHYNTRLDRIQAELVEEVARLRERLGRAEDSYGPDWLEKRVG